MANSIIINGNSLINKNKDGYNAIMRRFSMFDGAGFDLTKADSYEEALSVAKLDYSANKEPLYLKSGYELPNNFAITKSDNPELVLGVVGNQYQVVGNKEAFSVAEEIVQEGWARYEVGGPSLGSKNRIDYSRAFLVLRGDDFTLSEDSNEVFNSFIVIHNSFDGSTGVQYQFLCQRLVCLNGLTRYLGGKKQQLRFNIQHSKTAMERIQVAQELLKNRRDEIEAIKREAAAFIHTPFSRQEFKKEIIPLLLKQQKLTQDDKERIRGQERIERVIEQVVQAYEADDVQNYNNTAYRVILAMSDWETHASPLRDTGNDQIYMNRIAKGMLATRTIAEYIAKTRNISIQY